MVVRSSDQLVMKCLLVYLLPDPLEECSVHHSNTCVLSAFEYRISADAGDGSVRLLRQIGYWSSSTSSKKDGASLLVVQALSRARFSSGLN